MDESTEPLIFNIGNESDELSVLNPLTVKKTLLKLADFIKKQSLYPPISDEQREYEKKERKRFNKLCKCQLTKKERALVDAIEMHDIWNIPMALNTYEEYEAILAKYNIH